MMNNNGYDMNAQNNATSANFGRYQLGNGQFVNAMSSTPMFATVDVAGGYNALGTPGYQQYYQFAPTVYNPAPAEMFQNQLAYAAIPGAPMAYNAPPPAAFSRPPPTHLTATAQPQAMGNTTGQQAGYVNQTPGTNQTENINQYFTNTNTQNTGNQPSSRYATNNKMKQLSLFDNSSENYTASWVSSTSSIPPDLKVSPDHNSNPGSPHNEFAGNWTNEHGGASGSHPQLQHSSSVDEFAAGASATSGFSPPVDNALDQQLSNMNITGNAAAYNFPAQQMPTMNRSPVYFSVSTGQYFQNATGQTAYFESAGQMIAKVNEYQQAAPKQMELNAGIQAQQNYAVNANNTGTGGTNAASSWANVVKRSGNISVGETRIRTVITEPQSQAQNQHTGITGNGNERNAGAVGDNRNRSYNRNNQRFQGNQRNFSRSQGNGEVHGQNANTYAPRNNQSGGNRYGNQQNQGNNQFNTQRQISSPRGGNARNDGSYIDSNRIRPLNATQVPPPTHLNAQQGSSNPSMIPTMLPTGPIPNFYMPPNNAATGFAQQNMQQQRPLQANQWNQTGPVPLAAINPQQFMSRPSPPVHNGQPQQPTFSGVAQQFPPPASAPPSLVTPLYGNNQQLAQQKSNFKGTWLDQDMIPKDQTLMNYELAMLVQSHNQNVSGWKQAKLATPANPQLKNFAPPQGGLLYAMSGSATFPPRFGSPQQNPHIRRLRSLNQPVQRGKGGSPLKTNKKKLSKDESGSAISEEKAVEEVKADENVEQKVE